MTVSALLAQVTAFVVEIDRPEIDKIKSVLNRTVFESS
jgi:hypothetical protein